MKDTFLGRKEEINQGQELENLRDIAKLIDLHPRQSMSKRAQGDGLRGRKKKKKKEFASPSEKREIKEER